nr:hypothetical transcript [Hymenolepis microstoma]
MSAKTGTPRFGITGDIDRPGVLTEGEREEDIPVDRKSEKKVRRKWGKIVRKGREADDRLDGNEDTAKTKEIEEGKQARMQLSQSERLSVYTRSDFFLHKHEF